jgi:hypothetical protein
MFILEWSIISISGLLAISSIAASIYIFYKMKKSKDGIWRP